MRTLTTRNGNQYQVTFNHKILKRVTINGFYKRTFTINDLKTLGLMKSNKRWFTEIGSQSFTSIKNAVDYLATK